jgi:hypothetical protein
MTQGMRIALIAVALAASGCAPTETAYMKYPTTGKVVECGPYVMRIDYANAMATMERGCIDDYQRQGYVRVPGP